MALRRASSIISLVMSMPMARPVRSDLLCRQEDVEPATRSQVHDDLAGLEAGGRDRVAAREPHVRVSRNRSELGLRIAERLATSRTSSRSLDSPLCATAPYLDCTSFSTSFAIGSLPQKFVRISG